MWMVRRFFPLRWSYLWRQGFANLYRPNNQTLVLVVTIGLGTTFIGTLYFVQQMLIDRVTMTAQGNQGNMILFDIQNDQRVGVDSLVRSSGLPILQAVPVVTVKFSSIKGVTAETADSVGAERAERRAGFGRGASERDPRDSVGAERGRPGRWLFGREIRVTYRDSLTGTEKLVAGRLGKPVKNADEPVLISVDEEYSRLQLHAGIGDTIVFNVQGVPVKTIVGSLRSIDWRRLQPSFPILFPSGVLEQAPQFHVLITEVSSPEESARFQQAMVRRFPTVSVIDLRLVLSVLNDVLGKIGFVIRFMAAFSILTGVVVLIASVVISKFQRIQESVLLRTLGASRRQVRTIQLLEYFFLGSLAAVTGIALALGLTQALAELTLESSFTVHWMSVAGIFAFVCALTVLVGWYNSRGVLNRPPLEILRSEG
jgi:putative ABC transport system permease protein